MICEGISRMTVISNSTPLISLAQIGRFDLLHEIFGRIIIPKGVYDEVVTEGEGRAGQRETEVAKWIEVVEVKNKLAVKLLKHTLDKGESETVVLAGELKADWVIMDESAGRKILEFLSIRVIGVLGILLKAKEVGLIPEVKSEVDKLRTSGFRMRESLYRRVLQLAAESV